MSLTFTVCLLFLHVQSLPMLSTHSCSPMVCNAPADHVLTLTQSCNWLRSFLDALTMFPDSANSFRMSLSLLLTKSDDVCIISIDSLVFFSSAAIKISMFC